MSQVRQLSFPYISKVKVPDYPGSQLEISIKLNAFNLDEAFRILKAALNDKEVKDAILYHIQRNTNG